MAEYEVFPNAPVEEAIITIRLPLAGDLAERTDILVTALGDEYPVVEGLDDSTHPPAESNSPDERRVRLLSADRRRAIQISRRSFSYHLLRPYSQWEDFAARARHAFESLTESQSVPVSEVQVRYLNVFNLPGHFEDWSDYLAISPNVPPALDTGLTNFWMSLNLADPGVPATAIVTQTTEPPVDGLIACVFDIDTRSETFAGSSINGPQIWRELDKLREYKNRLFFEGLTERAKELFR